MEYFVEAEFASCPEGCQGMSVVPGPFDPDNVVEIVVDNTTLDQFAEGTDEVWRHFGEVGECFAADPLAFPP